jgi:cholesterol transport system auxiliary component
MKQDNLSSASRRRFLRNSLVVPLAGFVSACELAVPGQAPPPSLYRLTPKSTFSEDLPTVNWQLVVEAPVANAGLNTTRVSLRRRPTTTRPTRRPSWPGSTPSW